MAEVPLHLVVADEPYIVESVTEPIENMKEVRIYGRENGKYEGNYNLWKRKRGIPIDMKWKI